eukprot:6187869-Pleurochrysis_carterae.AAC.1
MAFFAMLPEFSPMLSSSLLLCGITSLFVTSLFASPLYFTSIRLSPNVLRPSFRAAARRQGNGVPPRCRDDDRRNMDAILEPVHSQRSVRMKSLVRLEAQPLTCVPPAVLAARTYLSPREDFTRRQSGSAGARSSRHDSTDAVKC